MKNFFKIFIFFMIIFLSPKVFAASQNISNIVEAIPNFGGGTYYATQPASVPVPLYQNIGTRYTGKLSLIEFYLDNSDWDWNYNKTYTITLNMATEDWRNNFMGPQVIQCNCDGSQQSSSSSSYVNNTFRFVSYKTIKFNFKLGSTMGCKTKFRLYSGNTSSTAITGVSNYNLSSIVISDTTTPPTPTPVAPVPTATPSPGNQDIINNNNQNTQNIIDNQSQNTQDIIDNNTQNTADIIENNNKNTQDLLITNKEGLFTCVKNYLNVTSSSTTIDGVTFTVNSDKSITINGTNNRSSAIFFSLGSTFTLEKGTYTLSNGNEASSSYLFVDDNRNFSYTISQTKTFTNSVTIKPYIRVAAGATISNKTIYPMITDSSTTIPSYIQYGDEYCTSRLDATTDAINNVNNSINNDNVDSGVGGGFFSDFNDQDFGLSSIITIPLNTIQSLTSQSCVALNIPIPFTNSSVPLPCMTEVYQQNVPTIYNLWKIVSFGIIAYFIAIDIFHMVKGFKDPESDKVEVLDL